MSAQQSKALVRRFFDDVLNKRTLAAVDDLFTPGYTSHDAPSIGGGSTGLEAFKAEIAMYHRAFPDVRWSVDDLLAAGDDTVVVRWTARGTHRDELNGIPPTGRSATVPGITILRIDDGQIAESWEMWDALGLMQQLGVVPAPGADEDADPAALARAIYDAFSRDDFDSVLDLAVEDIEIVFVPTGQVFRGHSGCKEFMQGFKTAFPDVTLEVVHQVVSGDEVVSEFTARGTHTGPLMTPAGAIPPTGRVAEWRVCEVWRLRDGKLAHLQNYQDSATLMRQLGLMPEAETA